MGQLRSKERFPEIRKMNPIYYACTKLSQNKPSSKNILSETKLSVHCQIITIKIS